MKNPKGEKQTRKPAEQELPTFIKKVLKKNTKKLTLETNFLNCEARKSNKHRQLLSNGPQSLSKRINPEESFHGEENEKTEAEKNKEPFQRMQTDKKSKRSIHTSQTMTMIPRHGQTASLNGTSFRLKFIEQKTLQLSQSSFTIGPSKHYVKTIEQVNKYFKGVEKGESSKEQENVLVENDRLFELFGQAEKEIQTLKEEEPNVVDLINERPRIFMIHSSFRKFPLLLEIKVHKSRAVLDGVHIFASKTQSIRPNRADFEFYSTSAEINYEKESPSRVYIGLLLNKNQTVTISFKFKEKKPRYYSFGSKALLQSSFGSRWDSRNSLRTDEKDNGESDLLASLLGSTTHEESQLKSNIFFTEYNQESEKKLEFKRGNQQGNQKQLENGEKQKKISNLQSLKERFHTTEGIQWGSYESPSGLAHIQRVQGPRYDDENGQLEGEEYDDEEAYGENDQKDLETEAKEARDKFRRSILPDEERKSRAELFKKIQKAKMAHLVQELDKRIANAKEIKKKNLSIKREKSINFLKRQEVIREGVFPDYLTFHCLSVVT